MSRLTEASQSLTAPYGGIVTLFQLDATALGDTSVHCFTRNTNPDGSSIAFGGVTYNPVDIQAEGFEWGGSGAAPTPTIKINNSSMLVGALARQYGDCVGATLTRIRTYAAFLDTGASPDPTLKFPIDVFRVERKASHNKVFIEFELAIAFDQEGLTLPGRQCLRDTCTHIYRRWNGSAFDYSKATCPYVGSTYFKRTGVMTTTASEDLCGKRLSDCTKRFPNQPLPTRSFPGMRRFTQ